MQVIIIFHPLLFVFVFVLLIFRKLLLTAILFIEYDVLFHPFFILKTSVFIAFLYIFKFVHFFLVVFYIFVFLLVLVFPFFNLVFIRSINFQISKIVIKVTGYFHNMFNNFFHDEVFNHNKSKDYFNDEDSY